MFAWAAVLYAVWLCGCVAPELSVRRNWVELGHAGTNLGPELSAGLVTSLAHGSYQQTISSQGYETDAISLGLTYGLSVK